MIPCALSFGWPGCARDVSMLHVLACVVASCAIHACSDCDGRSSGDGASSTASASGGSPRRRRLDELLAGPASKERFHRILILFGAPGGWDECLLPPWRDEAERRAALAHARAQLATWEDETRLWMAAGGSDEVPAWGTLVRTFQFYRNDQTADAAVTQLLGSPSLQDVSIIQVTRCDVFPWKRLARARLHPKRLIITNTVATDEDWSALLGGAFADLDALDYTADGSKAAYARILAGLPRLQQIACRNCRGNKLEAILERAPLVRRLVALDFSGTVVMREGIPSPLGDPDIDALVAARELRNLTVLDLRHQRFGAAAKARLRAAPQFAGTTIHLDP